MKRVSDENGFRHFIVLTIPPYEADKISTYSIINNWPPELIARYDETGLLKHSVGIRRLQETTVPFEYSLAEWLSENGQAPQIPQVGKQLEDAGFFHAYFFPVHDAQGNRGAVVWSGMPIELSFSRQLSLQMVAIHVFNKLAEIGAALKSGEVVLSEREIQCLSWTAAGKTSLEIAEILGLSEHTVNHYLNQVTRKLGAVNRTQAVVKAIRRGLIS